MSLADQYCVVCEVPCELAHMPPPPKGSGAEYADCRRCGRVRLLSNEDEASPWD